MLTSALPVSANIETKHSVCSSRNDSKYRSVWQIHAFFTCPKLTYNSPSLNFLRSVGPGRCLIIYSLCFFPLFRIFFVCARAGGAKKKSIGRQPYFLILGALDPPPPKYPPPSAPTQTKRVPVCSFWNSASICIFINTWNCNAAELWDKNWDTDAHAHVTYQAPMTGLHSRLHSPTLLLFLQDSTDYLMLAQSCKFGV